MQAEIGGHLIVSRSRRVQSFGRSAELTEMRLDGHVDVFFAVGAVQDKKDATQMIAQIGQGGLGLPDRDYYLDEGQEAKGLREAYRAHLERMFALVGRKPAAAKKPSS